MTVLEVRDLHTHFFLRRGVVKAVDGVSFSCSAARCWAWWANRAAARA
jgi:ABC-type dipeptide/oligopeptide/nickel transport system ATPase component